MTNFANVETPERKIIIIIIFKIITNNISVTFCRYYIVFPIFDSFGFQANPGFHRGENWESR